MNAAFMLFVLFFASLTTSVAQQPVATDSAYTIRDSVRIPTRSGVDISAIVVRKKGDVMPLPAILFYTTYFQGVGDAVFAKKSADRQYVGIVAYARGIRSDLRHYVPFEHEGTDVYDIIDWVSKQEWCDGTVGMYSGSYTGFSQWATVKNIHPALKTIVPQVAVMPGFDFPMENGVPLSHILSWSNDNIYKREPLSRSLPFEYFTSGIAFRDMDSAAGWRNPIFQRWLAHPTYDEYWQSLVPTAAEYANISIPVLTTTGYYDGAQIGALQYFRLHTQYNRNAEHYVVIGPYDHWGGQRKPALELMGYQIDSVAAISMEQLAYQWLDYILKGKAKPELLKDRVNYQVMGANEWRHASTLEAMSDTVLRFYFNKGMLDVRKPAKAGFATQIVDFKDRETQNNYFTPMIVFNTLDTSNGLVFTTTPFQEEFAINGSFTGQLVASINKKDMDISLALYELQADGTCFFLARYVGRASHAKDNSKRQLLVPHTKEFIPVGNTRLVSKQLHRGSRLVVLLNINKHPFEIMNYGSGKDVNDETIGDAHEPLRIQWHNESFIDIPIEQKGVGK